MFELSLAYCVGTPRAFMNMTSYVFTAMTQRVSYIYIYLALLLSSVLIDKYKCISRVKCIDGYG